MVLGFTEDKDVLRQEVLGNETGNPRIIEPYIQMEGSDRATLILPIQWKIGDFIKAVEGKKHFKLMRLM